MAYIFDSPTSALDIVNHHALPPTATFAAGFAVRPFGAPFFGRLGDIGAALRELVGGRQSAKAVERHFPHIATMSGGSISFAGALLIRRQLNHSQPYLVRANNLFLRKSAMSISKTGQKFYDSGPCNCANILSG